jgi:hypothetical protein
MLLPLPTLSQRKCELRVLPVKISENNQPVQSFVQVKDWKTAMVEVCDLDDPCLVGWGVYKELNRKISDLLSVHATMFLAFAEIESSPAKYLKKGLC